ncbi:hypothetical protein NIES4102_41280 (plasmid) [Chondrocystis sp. NIES-4102]|nr:hypothetical protein NIES4102_41280 [Chondrocystis sp. NIES-4102]
MNLKLKIKDLLDPYDSSQTECDGMTRICHTILSQHRIKHQPMIGTLQFEEQKIEPHLWIDLPSGERIDYRSRMWLMQCNKTSPQLRDRIPHGIFKPIDFPDVLYKGQSIELELLPPVVLEIMTIKFSYD